MNDNRVQKYISLNRAKFLDMVTKALKCKNESRQILLCIQATLFATNNPCGVFSAPEIESCLVNIASAHSVSLSTNYQPNNILHVFTRAFETGGHTRVCERWINACTEDQTHSVLFLNQGKLPIPDFLNRAVSKSGGEFIQINEVAPIAMALQLRKLASAYQLIVLHTHMHDVIPILAFGTKEFLRPVLLFNHADHLFWIGGAVADLVINFRSMASEKNIEWRGIERNTILPLPSGQLTSKLCDKNKALETKKRLGFQEHDQVIISIASSYKFEPFAGFDFIGTISKILEQNRKSVFLIIGPSPHEKLWATAIQKYPNRLKVTGLVPYSQLNEYIQVADISLESFPIGSLTALIDAVQYGIPCVALSTPVNNYDAFVKSGILCDTQEDIVERVSLYLQSPPADNKLINILQGESSPEAFRKNINKILENIKSHHQIYGVNPQRNRVLSDLELFVAEQTLVISSRKIAKMKYLIRYISYLAVSILPMGLLMRIYGRCYKYFLM